VIKNDLNIKQKLSILPDSSGVYLMKDKNDVVIYIGKAKNIKKRVSSYFNKKHKDIKTEFLVNKIISFDTILTSCEDEALLLESNLIKKYNPKYNVNLKDGKRYPLLKLDIKSDYPNLSIVRKSNNDGALYFGPFPSGLAVSETLKTINKLFTLRKCHGREVKKRDRACLNYQIKTCQGPCSNNVDKDKYNEVVKEVILFLKGKTGSLIKELKEKMKCFSDRYDYENAAIIRDKIFALEKILEKQVAVSTDLFDKDVFGIAFENLCTALTILTVRKGILTGTRHYYFKKTIGSQEEIIDSFIRQYYKKYPILPDEVIIPVKIEETFKLKEFLKTYNIKTNLICPMRGEKKRLLDIAFENAKNALLEYNEANLKKKDILIKLKKSLKMNQLPNRIECIDNSNISGTQAVAGIIVFTDGQPDKSSYRKYKIKSVQGPDDYATMKEVLGRRFKKITQDNNNSINNDIESYPDLLIVDGGKGQLNSAVAILKELKIFSKFYTIGIAKKRDEELSDKIYIPNRVNPVNIPEDVLLFIQRIRDEAHRFAINYHRTIRDSGFTKSILDQIHGIGKKRKIMLLQTFKSIENIKNASLEELTSLKGITQKLAKEIKKSIS